MRATGNGFEDREGHQAPITLREIRTDFVIHAGCKPCQLAEAQGTLARGVSA